MRIRCYGARGSIPVAGAQYNEFGGDTTCMEVRSDAGDVLVVDAGSGIRRLGNDLLAEDVREFGLFFTHVHWDHIMGLPFFKPAYRSGTRIHLYGCPFRQQAVKKLISRVMMAPYFPVAFDDLGATIDYKGECAPQVDVGGVAVTQIPLSHPNGGMGYAFAEGGRRFVFLTDNEFAFAHRGGKGYADYVEFSRGADVLIHDAEYIPEEYAYTRGWGHSLYTDALQLAIDARVGRFGLFHHNQDRTDEGVHAMLAACREIVAASDHPSLEVFGATQEMELTL